MTLLEALQSTVEYENPNTLEKVLIDLGLSASTAYTAALNGPVEVATAHVLVIAARTPEFREGSLYIKYTAKQLLTEAQRLFDKNGITTDAVGPTVSSNKLW